MSLKRHHQPFGLLKKMCHHLLTRMQPTTDEPASPTKLQLSDKEADEDDSDTDDNGVTSKDETSSPSDSGASGDESSSSGC